MVTRWLSINPFLMSQAILLLTVLSGMLFLSTDTYFRSLLKAHWRFISLAVLMVALWRFPFHDALFHGLEYEDSYVYTVSARGVLPSSGSQQNVGSAYLTSTCVAGSLDSCDVFETYSGHYIGWPSLIRTGIQLFGYTPYLPVYLNIFASCIAVVSIYVISQLATNDSVASSAAALIFATTPAFAVHGVASYAEPISNACISVVLLCYIRYLHEDDKHPRIAALNWFVLATALLFAVIVKRENVVMAVVLPSFTAICMVYRVGKTQIDKHKLCWMLFGSALVLVFSTTELTLAKTVLSEAREFGDFPFALSNAKTLLPLSLRAWLAPEWYSYTFVLVLVGIVYAFRVKSMALLVVGLLACYLLLYTFHVRDYYQTHGVPVLPYETLRYSMNLMSLWSLLAGLGIAAILKARRVLLPERKALVFSIVCAYAAGCYIQTTKLRQDVHADEYAVRIKPALAAARFAAQSGVSREYIVTLEPLIVQMFASRATNVLGLYVIDHQLLASLRDHYPGLNILYLKENQYGNSVANGRYARGLACLNSLPQTLSYTDKTFSLVHITLPVDGEIRCGTAVSP